MNKTILIIISGSSGSGKTTISEMLKSLINKRYKVEILNQDNFYNNVDYIPKNEKDELNFDHPDAFNWTKIHSTINDILNKKKVILNEYDYTKNIYTDKKVEINQTDVLIFEGIYALYDQKINNLANLKIFIKLDLDECLIRRIKRDITKRSRTIDSIVNQWQNSVRPMYHKYVYQTKNNADLILPWDKTKKNIIKLIAKCIELEANNKNNKNVK